jgi:CheY-like chemotaxis protein
MTSDISRHPLSILVVDDETMIAMFLQDMLLDLGCNVVGPAGAVAPAMALIEASGPTLDGALLDVNLRGELVYPVADALTRLEVPFVFVTGYAGHGIDARYATVTAVPKPFPAAAIDRVVRDFADRRRIRLGSPGTPLVSAQTTCGGLTA